MDEVLTTELSVYIGGKLSQRENEFEKGTEKRVEILFKEKGRGVRWRRVWESQQHNIR